MFLLQIEDLVQLFYMRMMEVEVLQKSMSYLILLMGLYLFMPKMSMEMEIWMYSLHPLMLIR